MKCEEVLHYNVMVTFRKELHKKYVHLCLCIRLYLFFFLLIDCVLMLPCCPCAFTHTVISHSCVCAFVKGELWSI